MLNLVRSAVSVLQLDVGLLPDAVQVLVEAVEEKGQQLVRVLLLVARELGGEAAHLGLENERTRAKTAVKKKTLMRTEEKKLFSALHSQPQLPVRITER